MGGRVDASIIVGLLEADGFQETRCKGQHRNYDRGDGSAPVTVSWSKPGDYIPIGTAKSIARRAGPHIEEALRDILGGGGNRALKQHIKAFRREGITL